MNSKWCVSLILTLALLGCQQTKRPTQKEQATKQWNAARASVMASLARGQYESGNFAQSQKTVSDALRLSPENSELHILAAKLAIERGDLEIAQRELELARKYNPSSAEADYLSGVVYQRWNKNQEAYDAYTQAAERAPNEIAYILARAEILVALDRSPEALELLAEKSSGFDQNAPLRDASGQIFVEQGRYPEAVESLRQASSLQPDDQLFREHLALAYFYNGQYRESAATFERVLKEAGGAARGELWLALGECQMQLGQTRQARATFERACELSGSSPRVWTSHAKAALKLGDPRRAEISLRKAMAIDPACSEIYLMLGYLRLREDRLDDALVSFRKANSLDRSDPVSLCMIGYVFEKQGHPDQAIHYYGRALKLRPNDELATKLMASVDMNDR